MKRTLAAVCLISLSLWMGGAGSAAAQSDTINVLHNFSGPDGATAKGSLTLVDNILFGRTAAGGASGNGAIFAFYLGSMTFNSKYSFTAGTANGTGNQPHHDSMTLVGSTLYGAGLFGGNTNNDGTAGNGVVFSVSVPARGSYSVVYALNGGASNSSESHSCFLASGSLVYGMSALGGLKGEGTIYSIDMTTGAYSLLYSFDEHTGSEPHGRLILASDGATMLGMTRKGGSKDFGVIFSFAPSTGVYEVLHEFTGGPADGATTDHGYLVLVGTTVYGMTTNGGSANNGVLFSMSEAGAAREGKARQGEARKKIAGSFQLLHTFGADTSDGSQPYGSLALSGEYLYGMAREGGANGDGTIFRIRTDGTNYATLASFAIPTTGGWPIDNVTISADGSTLYGLTQVGGAYDPTGSSGYGTIFSMAIPPPDAPCGRRRRAC